MGDGAPARSGLSGNNNSEPVLPTSRTHISARAYTHRGSSSSRAGARGAELARTHPTTHPQTTPAPARPVWPEPPQAAEPGPGPPLRPQPPTFRRCFPALYALSPSSGILREAPQKISKVGLTACPCVTERSGGAANRRKKQREASHNVAGPASGGGDF